MRNTFYFPFKNYRGLGATNKQNQKVKPYLHYRSRNSVTNKYRPWLPKRHVIKTTVHIHASGKIHDWYLGLSTQNSKGRQKDTGRKRKGVSNESNTPNKLQSINVPWEAGVPRKTCKQSSDTRKKDLVFTHCLNPKLLN